MSYKLCVMTCCDIASLIREITDKYLFAKSLRHGQDCCKREAEKSKFLGRQGKFMFRRRIRSTFILDLKLA